MPSNRLKTSSIDCSQIFSGDISLDEFLREYWQKKPLLIRNAFPGFTSPLNAEELAGLACEEEVNSRIVIEKDAERPWSVQYGPFDDDDFARLPEDHWTLLISDVEKHVDDARDIKNCFRFIPDWRMDDLMFSYAPEGGSVGPHLDAYDVFLLQASGRRNWMISYNHANQFLKDTDLSILAEFTPDESWILEPGDMLYLPPGIAHHGVATEPCITCSIGFRAPSVRAMISEYAEHVANTIGKSLRYEDTGLSLQNNPAEITPTALNNVKEILKKHIVFDDKLISNWLGEYLTENRSGTHNIEPDVKVSSYEELSRLFEKYTQLSHSPISKFLFTVNGEETSLFVDGVSYSASKVLSEWLCKHHVIETSDLASIPMTSDEKQILIDLYNHGVLIFCDETRRD